MSRVHFRDVAGVGPRLPVITVDSGVPGPVACITANLHGDECTGIAVAQELGAVLPDSLDRGRVSLYPSLNPEGLEAGTRGLPGTVLDPNRAFPGHSRGSPAERHAARIWEDLLAQRPHILIDLHTDSGEAIPYAIVDRVVRGPNAAALFARCVKLAEASGLTVLREYPERAYLRYELDRSLPGAMVNGPGVAAVTLEVGPRRRISRAAVEAATCAVLGVLHCAGLLDAPAPPHPSRISGGPWRRGSGPRVTREGLLVPRVGPGHRFQAGSLLAEVRTVDGRRLEALTARQAGFVVSQPDGVRAALGAGCATVGVFDD